MTCISQICTRILTVTLCSLNDPDNKSVTDKLVSEVKAQFPHFAEGDIKGIESFSYLH